MNKELIFCFDSIPDPWIEFAPPPLACYVKSTSRLYEIKVTEAIVSTTKAWVCSLVSPQELISSRARQESSSSPRIPDVPVSTVSNVPPDGEEDDPPEPNYEI